MPRSLMKGAWIWRVTKTTERPYSGARATRYGSFFPRNFLLKRNKENRVADPRCLLDPGSWLLSIQGLGSRIQDPFLATKEEGGKNSPFFISTNFTKFKIILFLNYKRKKNVSQFTKNHSTYSHKGVTKLSKIWVWEPGCWKNIFRISYSEVKKAPDPGSRSATLFKRIFCVCIFFCKQY